MRAKRYSRAVAGVDANPRGRYHPRRSEIANSEPAEELKKRNCKR
jgi:hypothetical protein